MVYGIRDEELVVLVVRDAHRRDANRCGHFHDSPRRSALGMAFDNPAATFFIVGTRGHALHCNAMDVHEPPVTH